MKGFKTLQMSHSRTAVSVPISVVPVQKNVLSGLPWMVPVPISVVPVLLFYCHFFHLGTGTNKCGIGTTL